MFLNGSLQSKLLYFFGQSGCDRCAEAEPHLERFAQRHPDIMVIPLNLALNPGWKIGDYTPKGTPAYLYMINREPVREHLDMLTEAQLEKFINGDSLETHAAPRMPTRRRP
jgi:thiol-disulfide isomerase/thioredoxin